MQRRSMQLLAMLAASRTTLRRNQRCGHESNHYSLTGAGPASLCDRGAGLSLASSLIRVHRLPQQLWRNLTQQLTDVIFLQR